MPSISHLIALAAAVATVAFAAPATTSGCTTATHTATFDNLPTGTINPKKNHAGLLYSGWEVVPARHTVFKAHSGRKILRLIGDTGTISTANDGEYYNDHGTPQFPSYYFGCQNSTVSTECEFSKLYNVSGQPTYNGLFNYTMYPHKLEAGGGLEPINTPEITWGITVGDGSTPPPDVHLYIDSYRYILTNCQS